jgi:formamidopyrimidine-DNA glycosylase
MADIPLYEGDTVILRWGRLQWECQVYRNDALCVKCGGATVRIDLHGRPGGYCVAPSQR